MTHHNTEPLGSSMPRRGNRPPRVQRFDTEEPKVYCPNCRRGLSKTVPCKCGFNLENSDGFLKMSNDPDRKVITIEGIEYSYELFKQWGVDGSLPENVPFMVKDRGDGLNVERVKPSDYMGD